MYSIGEKIAAASRATYDDKRDDCLTLGIRTAVEYYRIIITILWTLGIVSYACRDVPWNPHDLMKSGSSQRAVQLEGKRIKIRNCSFACPPVVPRHAGPINERGNEREEILFDTATHEWLIRDGFASRPRHDTPHHRGNFCDPIVNR